MFAGDVTVGLQIGGMTTFLSGWKGALAAVANFSKQAATAMLRLGSQAVDAGDQLQKLSQRIGWSTESLSEMRAVLELNDASMGDLQVASRQLARSLQDAARGSGRAAQALAELGVSVEDLGKLKPEERFKAVAAAIGNVEDVMQRSALASEVFGRSADRLLPTINALSRGAGGLAERINTVYTKEQADTFAEFNDMSSILSQALGGIGRVIAAQVLPMVNPLIAATATLVGEFSRWLEASDFIGQAASFVSKAWVVTWSNMGLVAGGIAKVFGQLVGAAVEWRNAFTGTFVEAKRSILEVLDGILQGIVTTFPEGILGNAAMRAVGLDPTVIRAAARLSEKAVMDVVHEVAQEANDAAARTMGASKLVRDIENIAVSGVQAVGDMVLSTTDYVSDFIRTSHEEFQGLMGSAGVAVDELGAKGAEVANELGRRFTQYAGVAAGALTQLVTQSGRSFGEVVANMLGALGEMSAKEGFQHILAGAAMLNAPGLQGMGRSRMRAGAKLVAWGAGLAALGRGLSGGGGGEGAGGGGGESPSIDDRTGPGYELDAERRQGVTVYVQGDMFDSRETWNRIAELARDHSDADIEIVQSALGRA